MVDEESGQPRPGEPAVGATIGRYQILSRVGAGAMGAVFAAHDPMLARRIALKVLHPGRRGPVAQQRLLREAQALARLGHPNVVTVNDVGTEGDLLYIAMELVEGQSLGKWLEASPRAWSEVLDIVLQAGRGLAAVHRADLVHRDFKPENVMVSEGRALVADFGIAQSKDDDDWAGSSDSMPSRGGDDGRHLEISDRLTQTGTMLGTPRYMAPEQFLSEPVDSRTDQFSFCIVLWEALYGQHPFSAGSLTSLTMSITLGELQPPPSGHGVPPRIHRVLVRGLSTRPADRFASMPALLSELERAAAPRQKALVLGVVAALAVGGVALAAYLPASSTTACDGRGSMDATWGPDDARQLQEAFEATGIPMARANGQQVVRRLEDYAERWVQAHGAQCLERRDADAETQILLDRRIACLKERRGSLDALIQVLQDPDPTIVENAASAVLELGELSACADDERLAAEAERTVEPRLAARVEDAQQQLDQVRALQSARADDRGLERLDEIEAQLRSIDYLPLQAEVSFLRGTLLDHQGESDRGRAEVERAFEIATAQGMDELVAKSALRLTNIAWTMGATADQARRWARHADAAIARLGRPPRLQVDYLEFSSFVLEREGNHREAQALLREALALVQREMPDNQVAASHVHSALGRIALMLGEHDEAIEQYGLAHDRLTAALGEAHPGAVSILGSMQEVYRAQGKFAEAHALDERVFPLLVAAYGPKHPEVVSMLVKRGSLLASEGFAEDALEYYGRALRITEERYGPDHTGVGVIRSNRGVVLSSIGRHDEAVADQRRALRIAEAVFPAEHRRIAIALDNLGSALVGAGRPAEAIPLHRRSLPIWSRQGDHSPSLAISLTDQALALLEHGESAEAVPLVERAVKIFESRTIDPLELARARFTLARSLAASNRDSARARQLASRARAAYVDGGERRYEHVDAIDLWTQGLQAADDG
ncbi:MAG: tetratricopeptide repeat protein [Myxococcota bacterium]